MRRRGQHRARGRPSSYRPLAYAAFFVAMAGITLVGLALGKFLIGATDRVMLCLGGATFCTLLAIMLDRLNREVDDGPEDG